MPTDLKTQFEAAIADSKKLSQRPGNDALLKLYSFYKQATEGDAPGDQSSNPFDFAAKVKYEAWAALKGKSREEAMREYVELVNHLKS